MCIYPILRKHILTFFLLSLTVHEHLCFYNGLKFATANSDSNGDQYGKLLADVGLDDKRDELVSHLSGGMKRKLSVAIAFTGNSKCVILDEPTAG